jgi:hypothetical protein
VQLRGLPLPQDYPQVCKGIAYCSKDCQVCICLDSDLLNPPIGWLVPTFQRRLLRSHVSDVYVLQMYAACLQMFVLHATVSMPLFVQVAYPCPFECVLRPGSPDLNERCILRR